MPPSAVRSVDGAIVRCFHRRCSVAELTSLCPLCFNRPIASRRQNQHYSLLIKARGRRGLGAGGWWGVPLKYDARENPTQSHSFPLTKLEIRSELLRNR